MTVRRSLLAGVAASALWLAAVPAVQAAGADTGTMHHRTETKPFQADMAANVPWFVLPADDAPILFDNLGTLHFPITTANAEAQQWFNQGLRLSYGFNHREALRAFRMAQRLDPDCAACYWGEALVLGPNINAPMDPEASAPAVAAVEAAKARADRASPKEQALIEALTARYATDPAADRATLDAAYADAMASVAARFPDDPDIAALHAEAVMDLAPWDYWMPGGHEPKGRAGEAQTALERALAENPDHPGAIHFYIHLVEASDRPERAEPYADRLADLVPGAGHLVHMPAHIYFRTGRWMDSLETNRRAVAADEAYLSQAQPVGIYPLAYYPHNVHFLMTSAQMAGDGDTALAAAEKLRAVTADPAAATIPLAQPVIQAPYFTQAQFGDPDAVLALPEPDDAQPFIKGAWHYARGVASAKLGDTTTARAEADAIADIVKTADLEPLTAAAIPAPDILTIARLVLDGRIAQAEGDLSGAEASFREAVSIQDGMMYMEPPYWYFPVRQSLGAVLLRQGRLDEARAVFEETLAHTPNNGWALYGLMRVQTAAGDTAGAEETAARFAQAWAGPPDIDLDRM